MTQEPFSKEFCEKLHKKIDKSQGFMFVDEISEIFSISPESIETIIEKYGGGWNLKLIAKGQYTARVSLV